MISPRNNANDRPEQKSREAEEETDERASERAEHSPARRPEALRAEITAREIQRIGSSEGEGDQESKTSPANTFFAAEHDAMQHGGAENDGRAGKNGEHE